MNYPEKILLIGTGQMSKIYARAMRDFPQSRIIGIVGSSQEKARAFAKEWSIPQAYGADEFLNGAPGTRDADGYILATSEWIREDYLRILGSLGKPVLVEKPLVPSLELLRQIKKIENFRSDLITVVHSLRMSPRFTAAKKLLTQGKVGEIRHWYARRNPSRRSVKRVLGKFDLAFWLSCHDVDLMSWMMESRVQDVTAFSRGKLDSEDDFILAHLRFENGAHAVSEVSWCSEPLAAATPSCVMSARGTKGQIEINDADPNVWAYLSDQSMAAEDTYESYELESGVSAGIFKSVVESWLKTSSQGKPGFCTFQEAENAIRVCDAISRSIKTGAKVAVDYT